MNKEFIPYEEALALKELGFDEYCLGKWKLECEGRQEIYYDEEVLNSENEKYVLCAAPLYQQAFRWFRKKYNFHYGINMGYEWETEIYDITKGTCIDTEVNYSTFEEAELVVLQKFIETIKTKSL